MDKEIYELDCMEMETNENSEIKNDFDQNFVLKTDHENKKTKEECKFCGKKFVNINKHLLTHSPRTRNPYACTLCNSVFPSKERHNWHIKNHHDTSENCEIKNLLDQNFVLEKGHEMETNDNYEIKNDFDQNFALETDHENCEIKNVCDQNFALEKEPLKVEKI